MRDTSVVEVYSAGSALEAYALKNALETAGVDARVVGDVLQAAAGDLPLGQPITPRIWVRKDDEQQARAIIEGWREQRSRPGDEATPWHCSACGEEVSGGFEVCWQCGAGRDGTADPQFQRERTDDEAPPDRNEWSPWQYSLMALVLLMTLFAGFFALLKFTATGDPGGP